MSTNFLKKSHGRLFDVFYLGPMQMYVGSLCENKFLKIFMILHGLLSILFNGHNYLYMNVGVINKKFEFVHNKNGKFQIQRLYNLMIMYPVFYHVYKTTNIPKPYKELFKLNIIGGFLYNLYWFISLL